MAASPIISAAIDEEALMAIQNKAAALGVSKSAFARHLLETSMGMSSVRLAAEIATKNRIMFHEACDLVDEIIARKEAGEEEQ